MNGLATAGTRNTRAIPNAISTTNENHSHTMDLPAGEEDARFKVLGYFYPPAKSAKFEYSETELSVYEQEIILGARVEDRSSAPPGTQKLTGTFTCQACDHRSCRPPRGIPFEVSFDIVPASLETSDIHQEIFDKITFAK